MTEQPLDTLSAARQTLTHSWASMLRGAAPDMSSALWPAGMEAAFGGVADALGLGPSRRMAGAMLAFTEAQARQSQAWMGLMQLVVQRWPEIVQHGLRRVWAPGAGETQPESIAAVLSLWAALADETTHDALHGETGASAMADCIRAATAVQAARNHFSEALCESLNLPSRAEMDEAFLEIQKLKRQLRRAQPSMASDATASKLALPKKPRQGSA